MFSTRAWPEPGAVWGEGCGWQGPQVSRRLRRSELLQGSPWFLVRPRHPEWEAALLRASVFAGKKAPARLGSGPVFSCICFLVRCLRNRW